MPHLRAQGLVGRTIRPSDWGVVDDVGPTCAAGDIAECDPFLYITHAGGKTIVRSALFASEAVNALRFDGHAPSPQAKKSRLTERRMHLLTYVFA